MPNTNLHVKLISKIWRPVLFAALCLGILWTHGNHAYATLPDGSSAPQPEQDLAKPPDFSVVQASQSDSLAPTGTAVANSTKTVDFAPGGDLNDNGIVDEGDILRYTVTVSNSSGIDLENVVFTDTLDAATTLSGTLQISALAVPDAIGVANGGTANENVTTNDTGSAPLQVISFGDSPANAGTFPADGATVGSFPASGGGTIDVTIGSSGDLSTTANGTTGTGTVTIYYEFQAANGTSDITSVTITFGDFPTAVDDTLATLGSGNEYSTDVGVTLNIGAGTGLLNNDSLGNPAAALTAWGGGDASANVDRAPGTSRPFAGGTLTINADGSFDLVNPTTPGVYNFDYIIENSLGNSQAAVEIYINDPPVAQDDALNASLSQSNNYPASTLFNDNGSSADYLGAPTATLVSFGGGSLGGAVTDNAAGASVAFAGGTLTVNANGSLAITNPTVSGVSTFEYRIQNASGTSDATVTVTIQATPVAQPDAYAFSPSANQNVAAGAGLFVDNGSGADTLGFPTATLVSFGDGSLGGAVTDNAAGASVALAGGTLMVNADGSWSLTGQPFTAGTYTFDYRLQNASGSSDATVTLQVGIPPACTADSYAATGNISINTTNVAGNDVMQNDSGSDITVTEVQGVGTNVGTDTATANGGTVNMTAAGEFAYDPPTGFTGNDTFTYTIDNLVNSPATCTVTITVSNLIYFMDSAADAGGDGSLSDPFQSPAEHNGSIPANSNLFVADNGAAYTGPLTLASGERVIGAGTTGTLFGSSSLTGITLAPLSDSVPYNTTGDSADWAQLTNGAGDGITANANNTISGVSIGNTSGFGLIDNGSSVGTLTLSEVEINGTGGIMSFTNGGTLAVTLTMMSSTSSSTAPIILTNMEGSITNSNGAISNNGNNDLITVSGGSVGLTIASTLTKNGGSGSLLNVAGGHSGALVFNRAATVSSASSDGIQLDNADGTYTFNNVTSLTAGTAGVNIQNGSAGTLSITHTSSSIENIAGVSFRINNSSANVNYDGNITHSSQANRGIEIISGAGTISFDGTTAIGNGANPILTAEGVFLDSTGAANLISFNYLDISAGTSSPAVGSRAFVSQGSGRISSPRIRITCQGSIGADEYCFDVTNTTSSGVTVEYLLADYDDLGESGGGIALFNTPGAFTFQDVAGIASRNADAVFGSNFGTLNFTGSGSIVAEDRAAFNLTNGSVNVSHAGNVTTYDSTAYGINLVNVSGPLFRITGAVALSGAAGGSNALINMLNSTVSQNDIGDGNSVTLTDRGNSGIAFNNVSGFTNFGATTVNNVMGVTESAVHFNTVSGAVDFDSLTVNQGNSGTGETFSTSFPVDNSGAGDAVYGNGAMGGLTINGGTISNVADDGFDWRNSGTLILTNVSLDHQNGGTGTAVIQAFNSQGLSMNGGSITNFGSPSVGGQRPLGVNILHNSGYTNATGTFTFDSVDFDGGVGNALGGGIAQYLEDNASISVSVTNGSTFTNVYGKAIITQNGSGTAGSSTGGTVATTVTGNQFNSPLSGGQSTVEVASGGTGMSGNVAFNINNNMFTNWGDGAGTAILINLNQNGNARTQTNTINNNTMSGGTGVTMVGVFIDESSGLRLQANGNTGSVSSTGTALNIQALGTWTAGEADISMTGGSYVTSGLSGAFIDNSGAGDMRVTVDNVTIQTTDVFPFEGLYLGNRGAGTLDAVFTQTSFLASDFAFYVTQSSTGTMCLDLNDDGAGNNTFNTGYSINRTNGTLNLENGNTTAAVNSDNTFIGSGVQQVNGAVTAFGGECAAAVALRPQQTVAVASGTSEIISADFWQHENQPAQKLPWLAKPAAPSSVTAGETVTATVSILPDGKSVTFTYDAVVGSLGGVAEILNQGEISGDGMSPAFTDDPSQPGTADPTIVTNLELSKTTVLTNQSGNDVIIDFTITVNNLGTVPVSDVVVSDILPAAATVLTNSATSGSYNPVSGEWHVSAVGASADETLTLQIEVPLTRGDTLSNTAEIISLTGLELDSSNNTATAEVTRPLETNVYLPLIMNNHASLPDLVISNLSVSGSNVSITVENIGNTAATADFWVDLYLNPDPVPTAVNQIWQQLGDEGAAWGVTQDVPAGSSITLTIGDAYYHPSLSFLPAVIPPGTQIYAQVDSANVLTTYGAIIETHESTGGTYNNIASTTANSVVSLADPAKETADQPQAIDLPQRK